MGFGAFPLSRQLLEPLCFSFQQQQLQHLSHHAPPIPLTPHPSGLPPSSLAGTSGLLALSGALVAQTQLAAKDDRVGPDAENSRGKAAAAALQQHVVVGGG